MAEYIKRETAVRAVMAAKWVDGSDGAMAMEIVASPPAADVVPVVHGRWDDSGRYTLAEYIAREELLAQLRAMESYNASPVYRRGYDDCVEAILKAPAADVALVKHAHWIEQDGMQICSGCGEEHTWDDFRAAYCDCCGAKMDGGADND